MVAIGPEGAFGPLFRLEVSNDDMVRPPADAGIRSARDDSLTLSYASAICYWHPVYSSVRLCVPTAL